MAVLGGELPFQGEQKRDNKREMFDAENGKTVKPPTVTNFSCSHRFVFDENSGGMSFLENGNFTAEDSRLKKNPPAK